MGMTSTTMTSQLEAYSFITSRQDALSDARYALNRISNELMLLGSGDVEAISDTSIQFVDSSGVSSTFSSANNAGQTAIFRSAEVLLTPVQDFSLAYYDENNAVTADPAQVRQIQVSLATAPRGEEGSISLTTRITPRAFIYESYR